MTDRRLATLKGELSVGARGACPHPPESGELASEGAASAAPSVVPPSAGGAGGAHTTPTYVVE